MTRLTAIEVKGFRAFAAWERLELCPLTLLYGRNNAGKSSLVRLLMLLADSVAETAISALDMRGPAGRGGHFKDLPWSGDGVPRSSFRVRLHWSDGEATGPTDEIELVWSDERNTVFVRRWAVLTSDAAAILNAEVLAAQDDSRFEITEGGVMTAVPVDWTGLLPAESTHHGLNGLRARLLNLRRAVLWLDSNRPRPERLVQAPGGALGRLEHDGSNALEVLISDPAALADVAGWYARAPIDRDLRFEPVHGSYHRPMLSKRSSNAWFHLLDAGEGMAHVLPVLVGAALVRARRGLKLLAVEEPESHLHGDAQRLLVEHLARLAREDDPPIVVLETHSRALLLGVQLAVAGGLQPHLVSLNWCEQGANGASTLHRVRISPSGGLVGWPRQALSEELEMSWTLLDAQEREGV